MLKLEDDRYCFACGEKNPMGLKLSFDWDGETLKSSFTPQKEHQGYKDVVHGGIISTVLDECMAWATIRKLNTMAATAEFSVRLKSPLKTGEETLTEAKVENISRKLVEASSIMKRVSDAKIIATARAKLVLP
jgi:acyl-coenzyme A thioesterase PaaI-like protein